MTLHARLALPLLLGFLLAGCGDDGSGGGSGGGSSNDTYATERQACVGRINGFRAGIGLGAYARWTAQESCADGQASSDGQTGTAHGAFGDCSEMAQNECPGWGSLDEVIGGCLQMMWDEGPGQDFQLHGHYINMSSSKYTKVACGFSVMQNGSVWAVQDFR